MTLSDWNGLFLIEANKDTRDEDVTLAYKELIKLFQGTKNVSIVQDFRELNTILGLEAFDEVMNLCKKSGLNRLNVATITNDMSRAFTAVLVQEISDKYGIKLKVHYNKDIPSAKKWLKEALS